MAASYLKPPSFFVGDSASFLHDATIMSWTSFQLQRAHKLRSCVLSPTLFLLLLSALRALPVSLKERRFFGHHASHAPIFAMSFDSRWLAAAGHGRSEHDIHVSCEEFHFCRCMVCHRDFCSIAVPTLSLVLALFLEALLAAIGMPAIFNLDLGPLF